MSFQHFETTMESRPIRDIAYEQLKHAIITGEIPAGSRIVETVYAEQLHISRTPLREALRKLERDGLVEYVLHRGVVVRAFTIHDIDEIFTIRNAMMMLLLPSIVQNVTDEALDTLRGILKEMDVAQEKADADALAVQNRAFHRTIEHLSDKIRILRVIESQEEYITRFASLTIASIVRRSNAHQEHHQMVDLLEKRDLEGLKTLMHHHLEESKETCLQAVAERRF
ncbi:MAG: GntR family transcriptional regulator [Clostridia bacterium]|nr:GntR family transcriptional regulator [Clostridia bacterium]